ncbi:MAG: hypothetical protein MSH20_02375 [Lachnospiraceae bacterium]|nr:hypothetical protein [Lachnospiraceae bacterium]
MSSRTKIIVLHMKELIYTGIFIALGILFIVLLAIMFLPSGKKEKSREDGQTVNAYIPGIYTTSIELGGSVVDVEIVVDENSINSLRLVNLDEAVATMYPLIEPSFEELSGQITENQSLEGITYSDDSRYTSILLLNAVEASLEKAANHN